MTSPTLHICWILSYIHVGVELIQFIVPLCKILMASRTAPMTLRRTIPSNASSALSSRFIIIHVAVPYNWTGMIRDLLSVFFIIERGICFLFAYRSLSRTCQQELFRAWSPSQIVGGIYAGFEIRMLSCPWSPQDQHYYSLSTTRCAHIKKYIYSLLTNFIKIPQIHFIILMEK